MKFVGERTDVKTHGGLKSILVKCSDTQMLLDLYSCQMLAACS